VCLFLQLERKCKRKILPRPVVGLCFSKLVDLRLLLWLLLRPGSSQGCQRQQKQSSGKLRKIGEKKNDNLINVKKK